MEIIRAVLASTVLSVLDKQHAMFGYPDVIKSDNGAPFNSDAFASFAKHNATESDRIEDTWQRTS